MTKQVFKEINQFALLAMIADTKIAHLGLSVNERALLTALINFRNAVIYDKTDGFEAWPSIDTLTEYAGLKDRTIHTCKTSLAHKDFIKIRSGKGQGNNNHYIINARKIVECYNTEREHKEKLPDNRHYDEASITTTKQERNTSGLKKGTKACTSIQISRDSTIQASTRRHTSEDRGLDDPTDFALQLDRETEEVSQANNGINNWKSEVSRIATSACKTTSRKTENCVYFESEEADEEDDLIPF